MVGIQGGVAGAGQPVGAVVGAIHPGNPLAGSKIEPAVGADPDPAGCVFREGVDIDAGKLGGENGGGMTAAIAVSQAMFSAHPQDAMAVFEQGGDAGVRQAVRDAVAMELHAVKTGEAVRSACPEITVAGLEEGGDGVFREALFDGPSADKVAGVIGGRRLRRDGLRAGEGGAQQPRQANGQAPPQAGYIHAGVNIRRSPRWNKGMLRGMVEGMRPGAYVPFVTLS